MNEVSRSLKPSPFGLIISIVGVIAIVLLVLMSGKIIENVDVTELAVCRDIDGEMHIYTESNWYWQNFGDCTHYRKSFMHEFEGEAPLKICFNDNGCASIFGSIRADMPLDPESILKIHTKFGSQLALETQLIYTVVSKAVLFTGPLMSSKESNAERRNDLINFIEDQALHGVYKTTSKDEKVIDELSGESRTIKVTKIVQNEDMTYARQEQSPIAEFNLRLYNLAPTDIDYDEKVEAQLSAQQQIAMKVQQSIAEAKQAEQAAITAEQEGKAAYERSKWSQEEKNAVDIALAEKTLTVQKLAAQTAEQYKREQQLRGEGDSAYKRAVIVADGALTQKLETWLKAQEIWAEAFAKYSGNMVPGVVVGSGVNGQNAVNGAQMMMDAMGIKAMKDLSLDMSIKK